MFKVEKDGYYITLFDSVFEHIDQVYEIRDKIPTSEHWNPEHVHGHDSRWVGREFTSWQDAVNKANDLWKEGMCVFDSIRREIEDEHIPTPKTIARKRRWSEDDGEELSVDRILRGQPYWNQIYRARRPGPVNVTILSEVTTSGALNTMSVLWRGAAVTVLTELLEQAGFRVEIWAVQHCKPAYYSYKGVITGTRLKLGSDPLDVSSLINATSGWFYRTFFFGAYWLNNDRPQSGLGTILPISRINKEITSDEQVVICQQLYDLSSAVRWIKDQLQQFQKKGEEHDTH